MDSLPEEPQTMNAQLRKLPAYQPLLASATEPTPTASIGSRLVATLLQLKDTAAILLLLSDGSLLFGIFLGFGVPGLVLYGLRWRQARGRAGRGAIIVQAVLTLLHEVFWTCVFYGQRTSQEPLNHYEVLTVLYALGALLSVLQLLATLMGGAEQYEQSANYPGEQLAA